MKEVEQKHGKPGASDFSERCSNKSRDGWQGTLAFFYFKLFEGFKYIRSSPDALRIGGVTICKS